jgi:hypothetical protein
VSAAVGSADVRSNLEKIDDLQAAHPFPYNLVVGLVMGLVLVLIGFHPVAVPVYALSYAALRTYLWGDARLLRRQYAARKARWAAKQAERRRRH